MPSSLEEAERDDELEMDMEDQLVAEMKSRGPQQNVSTFAFTATPKEKTLELFGHRDERGRYAPFSLIQHATGHRGGVHPRRAPELRFRADPT